MGAKSGSSLRAGGYEEVWPMSSVAAELGHDNYADLFPQWPKEISVSQVEEGLKPVLKCNALWVKLSTGLV